MPDVKIRHCRCPMQTFLTTRNILVISPDEPFLRKISRVLEQAGYAVLLSSSLEDSFFDSDPADLFLVIIDPPALAEKAEHAQKLVKWFHRGSTILLLTNQPPEYEYDHCLPKNMDENTLLAWIEGLRR